MDKEFSPKEPGFTYSKDLISLEEEITNLDDITEWASKIKKMKEIKDKLILQKNKINHFISMVNSDEIKKISKKKKHLTIDELLKEFGVSEDIEEKIKIFNQIQLIVKDCEGEMSL